MRKPDWKNLVMRHDRADERNLQGVYNYLESSYRQLDDEIQYSPEVIADIFVALFGYEPTLKEHNSKDRLLDAATMEALLGNSLTEQLRVTTRGSALMTAISMPPLALKFSEVRREVQDIIEQAVDEITEQMNSDSQGGDDSKDGGSDSEAEGADPSQSADSNGKGMEGDGEPKGKPDSSAFTKALQQAMDQSKKLADAAAGMGISVGELEKTDPETLMKMSENLDSLASVFELVGAFIADLTITKNRKVSAETEFYTDVDMGDDLMRLTMGSQMKRRFTPTLFKRDWAQKRLEVRTTRPTHKTAKGPVIIVVDESGSMSSGSPRQIDLARALALALNSHHKDRGFAYIGVSSSVRTLGSGVKDVISIASEWLCGGTEYSLAFESIKEAAGELPGADVVWIGDGMSHEADASVNDEFTEWLADADVKVHALWTGGADIPEWLQDICTTQLEVSDLDQDIQEIIDALA